MHVLEMIATNIQCTDEHHPGDAGKTEPGICCITGAWGETVDARSLIGPSFTTRDLLALPLGNRVGVPAWTALKYRWERASSWIVTRSSFSRLNRSGVRAAVLRGPMNETWAGYCTTTYKKHGGLLAPVNPPGRAVWQFDDLQVDCSDMERTLCVWQALRAIQDAGASRAVIETLECPPWLLRSIGARRWIDFYSWAMPISGSPLYRFLCYLLPSKEEMANTNDTEHVHDDHDEE